MLQRIFPESEGERPHLTLAKLRNLLHQSGLSEANLFDEPDVYTTVCTYLEPKEQLQLFELAVCQTVIPGWTLLANAATEFGLNDDPEMKQILKGIADNAEPLLHE